MKFFILPVLALAMTLSLAGCDEEDSEEVETEEVEEAEDD
jgi:uncharacterized lipoprotein YehR (DUF1307 family)